MDGSTWLCYDLCFTCQVLVLLVGNGKMRCSVAPQGLLFVLCAGDDDSGEQHDTLAVWVSGCLVADKRRGTCTTAALRLIFCCYDSKS